MSKVYLKRKILIWFSILMFLIIIPNLTYYLVIDEKRVLTVLVNNLLIITLSILLMKHAITKIFAVILLIAFVLNNGLDMFSLCFYREPFNISMAMSFLSTNAHESAEMIFSYWYAILLAIIYLLLLLYIISKSKDYFPNRFLLSAFILISAIPIYYLYSASKSDKNTAFYKKAGENYTQKYVRLSPINTLGPFLEAHHYLSLVQKVSGENFEFPSFRLTDNAIEDIVVIIGESARRDALGIYGNPENTTPLLDDRISNLLIYDNAIAPAEFTNLALSLILSKQLPDQSFSVEKNQDNIIALANDTKLWETYWVSNQEQLGLYVNLFANIDLKAKYRRWAAPESYDEALLPILDSILLDKRKKRLIFIHLKGSHQEAGKRYPQAFDKFKSNNLKFKNEYNNSIFYTDYIIDQIIKRVEKNKSIVIYLSDHGQGIENLAYRHSFTKKGLDVPFFIWHSNTVDHSFKKSGRVASFISTTNLYNILSKLMGIEGLKIKDTNDSLKVLDGTMVPSYYKNLRSGE